MIVKTAREIGVELDNGDLDKDSLWVSLDEQLLSDLKFVIDFANSYQRETQTSSDNYEEAEDTIGRVNEFFSQGVATLEHSALTQNTPSPEICKVEMRTKSGFETIANINIDKFSPSPEISSKGGKAKETSRVIAKPCLASLALPDNVDVVCKVCGGRHFKKTKGRR